MTVAPGTTPAVVWSWSHALLGAVYAVPAAVVAVLVEPSAGLALAVGVLPAAAAGLPGPRRARMAIVIVGALMGTCMLVGSLLAQVPAVAVPAIFGLCVGAWPARPAPEPHAHGAAEGRAMLGYGVLLGLAGATAAAAGFLLHLDHVGWVCGAALMVMRPNRGLLRLRGVDRVWSVLAGAAAGGALVLARPPTAVLVTAVVVALAALAATKGSHRYVTPMFTTFLVFLLLLVDNPQETAGRFLERMGETVLGVTLAVIFGLVVPALLARRHRSTARS